jgi:hypothetical protein
MSAADDTTVPRTATQDRALQERLWASPDNWSSGLCVVIA